MSSGMQDVSVVFPLLIKELKARKKFTENLPESPKSYNMVLERSGPLLSLINKII